MYMYTQHNALCCVQKCAIIIIKYNVLCIEMHKFTQKPLAAHSNPQYHKKGINGTRESNIMHFLHLYALMFDTPSMHVLVYASSSCIYTKNAFSSLDTTFKYILHYFPFLFSCIKKRYFFLILKFYYYCFPCTLPTCMYSITARFMCLIYIYCMYINACDQQSYIITAIQQFMCVL